MSDDDLIRRGDALDILSEEGWLGDSLERIAALPAVAAPDSNVQKMHIADPAALLAGVPRYDTDPKDRRDFVATPDGGWLNLDEALAALSRALTQKGGDAFDQDDDPIDARSATSPGVTAGADAAQARPTATVSDDGGIIVMRGDAATVIEAATILRDKLLVLVPLEPAPAAQAREAAMQELIDAYEDIMDYGIVFAKKAQHDRLKAAKEALK